LLKLEISAFDGGGQSKTARAKTIEYPYNHFTSSIQKSNKKL